MLDELYMINTDTIKDLSAASSTIANTGSMMYECYFSNLMDLLELINLNKDTLINSDSVIFDINNITSFYTENKGAAINEFTERFKSLSNVLIDDLCKNENKHDMFLNSIINNYNSFKADYFDYFVNQEIYDTYFIIAIKNYFCSRFKHEKKYRLSLLPNYFIYEVPAIDDRFRNQQSLFVFQPFVSVLNQYQFIKADVTIEITNKIKILNQLDNLGINKKYIFRDFDNIGQYCSENL